MKTRNIVLIILGVVIVLIGLIFLIGSVANLTIFGARPQLQCGLSGSDISCSVYRDSGGNLASQIFIDGKQDISIVKPSKVSEFNSLMDAVTTANTGINYDDWICSRDPTTCGDTTRTSYNRGHSSFMKENLGQQVMIVEGKVFEMEGDDTRNAVDTGRTATVYGFGSLDSRNFIIQDPFPGEQSRKYLFKPSSFIIKSKVGGYTEADLIECNSGQTKCDLRVLIECINNHWVIKGEFIGQCGVECVADEDCTGEEIRRFCDDNELKSTIKDGVCLNNKCSTQTKTEIIETCEVQCNVVEGVAQCIETAPLFRNPIFITIAILIVLGAGVIIFFLIKRRR